LGTRAADQLAPHKMNMGRRNIPLLRAIRSSGAFAVQDLPPGPAVPIVAPKRLRMTSIDGVFVEDAYIDFVPSTEA
jgi:hypothetical protein